MAKSAADGSRYLAYNHLGDTCGKVYLDMDQFDVEREAKLALIAGRREGGFWALLLRMNENGQTERWGIADLSDNCLDESSPYNAWWEKIYMI